MTPVPELTLTPFETLIAACEAAGVQTSMNPSELNLPAAWLQLDQLRGVNMDGNLRLECNLFLISPDTDPMRAVEQLGELFDLLVPAVLTPDGPTVTEGVVMPDSSTPLPALRVPVYLYTIGE